MPPRPHYTVACALIERGGRVLVAQRPPGKSLALKWEFPGGKLERGESAEAALVREIREELHLDIVVGDALPPTTHDYDEFTITLVPFRATAADGDEPHAAEHVALRWCGRDDLRDLDWAAADLPVLMSYLKLRTDWFVAAETPRAAGIAGEESELRRLSASPWFDALGFAVGLGLAWYQGWATRDLVWSLWLSSLVIGYATIVLGIASGVWRGSANPLSWLGGLFFLGFFTVHFGGFHFVHSIFLNGFFPQGATRGPPTFGTYLGLFASYWPWLIAAAVAERGALLEAWRGPANLTPASIREREKNRAVVLSRFDPMGPYVNVVRMHCLIFFFAFTSFAGLDNFAVYGVAFALYFFPWRLVWRKKPAARHAAVTG